MAADSSTELLFLDTFKHQNAELTNIDVVRFPCGVLITEVRVIPPGIKAHSSLPDSRAFGETAPHAFQLDLFFNNASKPNAPVFDRLGSLDYDENKSIIFRPNSKVNTDGLVLRGWYTCLTLAVYGTAERTHPHERDSPPPPPPPPPQQPGAKRNSKHEWENEEPFNGSPPRPQPRGPRTPPGPPPPDDDDDEALPVPGPVKEESVERGEDYLEPVSPERGSLPADDAYSDAEQEEEDGPGDDEDEEDARTEGSEGEEEEEEEGEEEMEDDGEGDDGYEQISSDEEDLDTGAFKLPAFDLDYTPEDLASLPSVQYDPFERELHPLQHFTPPHITRYEAELLLLKDTDLQDPASPGAESAAKLSELLEAWGEGAERGAGWVTALEEVPALLVKGLSYAAAKEPRAQAERLRRMVEWSGEALRLDSALAQPIALNLRQLKAGTKLASALAELGAQAVEALLERGAVTRLLELLFAEHVSSTLKLNVLRSLDAIVSQPRGMQVLLGDGRYDNGAAVSGYQRLLELFLLDQTVRVATAGAAILQKGHFFEVLTNLQRTAASWAERQPAEVEGGQREKEGEERDGEMREGEREGGDRETPEAEPDSPMDIDTLLASSAVSEADLEKLQGLLEELLHLLETAPHCMVQPPGKAFPTSARITGPPERDDPYPTLYRYMLACHFLESLAVVLSSPAVCAHIGVLQAVRELMRFLSQTQQGLLFLLSQHEPTNLLLRLLAPLTHLVPPAHLAPLGPLTPLPELEGEETAAGGEASMEDGFWVWLLQALHALQGVAELSGAEPEEGDSPEVLATLHSLYLISFSGTGRSAVAHTLCLDNNLGCLVSLLEHHAKEGLGEGKARKSVTYNYACMLVLLAVQSSTDLRTMEQYAVPLLSICKADENNAKLQELSKWLEPLEKLRFEISSIPTLIDYIKQNMENLMTPEGVGLITALRVLCHIACPPPSVPGQQKDLKWNQAVIALFSAEGMDSFIKILQKLTSLLLLPWRLHGPMGPSPQRLMMLSLAWCALRLVRAMLTELLCGGACEFRDARVPAVCVALHTIVCSAPVSGRLDAEELRVQGDVAEVLLTFTHAVSEQETGSEETVAGNSWSLMLKEVLNSVLTAPENIHSGLSLLSELLPLPLPMQTTQALSVQDVGVALNTRKLWSMHLHAQARVLQEVLRCVCVSSCPPLLSMLRRVCVQLCDLAAPTATLVMRTLLEQLQEEMQQEAASARLPRLLALLESLASQRSCKAAMLPLLGGSARGEVRGEGKAEDKLTELLPAVLTMLLPPAEASLPVQQSAELTASIIQSLCDQDISLVVSGSGEACVSEAEQLANALPPREMLASVCDGMLEVLGHTHNSYTLQLTCLRTMMFLTEHDYGLYHLKSSLKKHSAAMSSLIRRETLSFNKESAELLSALLDFLRQILNSDSMDEDMDARSLALSVGEMKQLLQWKEDSEEHPLQELEKHITELFKEDDSLETLLENVVGLRQILESSGDSTPSNTEPDTEPTLPPPEPLQTQFNHRTVYVLSDALDEQLKALWFSPFQTDDMETDLDMVKVDLVALAQQCCPDLDLKAELERSFLSEPASPGHSKPTKGFRLGKHKHETFITSSGKSEYIEPAKRAHIMAAPRGRGRGAFGQLCRPHDIFRQRKQNTSRPPSMHVDDFLAAEIKDVGPPTGLAPPKRPPKGGAKPPARGLFTGGARGRGFQSHTRFFTPPAPKTVLLTGNYPRREGGRGSTWSTPVTAVTHRGTYSEPRGGQSNFTRPLPSRQPPTGAYRLAPRDRAPRGRGTGLSWITGGGVSVGGGGVSVGGRGQGKFSSGGSGGGGRARHVRSFTR